MCKRLNPLKFLLISIVLGLVLPATAATQETALNYRDCDAVKSQLEDWARKSPQRLELTTIGSSAGGKDIVVARLASGGEAPDQKPAVILGANIAGFHNFAHAFQFDDREAGPWPGYTPESKAVMDFLLARRNVAVAIVYGPANHLLATPRGFGGGGDIGSLKFKVPGAHGRVHGIRPGRGIHDRRDLGYCQRPTDGGPEWHLKRTIGSVPGSGAGDEVEWKPFDHPQYGPIEIGGYRHDTIRVPEGWMLEEECHRNAAFVLFHADQMPMIRFDEPTVKKLDGDLWRVHVPVVNERSIPTVTAIARKNKIHRVDVATVKGAKAVSSGVVQDLYLNKVDVQSHRPERLMVPGVGGLSSRTLFFLVEGKGTVSVEYDSVKAGKITTEIELR